MNARYKSICELLNKRSANLNPHVTWKYDADMGLFFGHYRMLPSSSSLEDACTTHNSKIQTLLGLGSPERFRSVSISCNDGSAGLHISITFPAGSITSDIEKKLVEDQKAEEQRAEQKNVEQIKIRSELLEREKLGQAVWAKEGVSEKNKTKALVNVLNKLCKGLPGSNPDLKELKSVKWFSNANQEIVLKYNVQGYSLDNTKIFKAILAAIELPGDIAIPALGNLNVTGVRNEQYTADAGRVFSNNHLFHSTRVVDELQKELNKKPSNTLPLVTGIGGGVMLGIGIATGGLALAIAGGIVMLASFIKAIWSCCVRPSQQGVFGRSGTQADLTRSVAYPTIVATVR